MTFNKQNALALSVFLFCTVGFSQINHPKASPFSRVEQEVGLSKIMVEYSRPAVRGRKILGELADGQAGLVPYGRIWRVGANESTKFTVDSDVQIMGNDLPKGTYALYAFPQKKEWEIVFHKNTSHWGDGRKDYDPEEDVFRVKVKPEVSKEFQENFLITFDSVTHNSSNMIWQWENTKISIPIIVDTHTQMMYEILKQIKDNPTAQTYYEAARYLQEQGKEYRMALDFLQKAIEIGGDTYYFHRVKSLVEAALGDYTSAIRSAEKSLKIAEELEKDEFVRMNKKNIRVWLGKLKTQK